MVPRYTINVPVCSTILTWIRCPIRTSHVPITPCLQYFRIPFSAHWKGHESLSSSIMRSSTIQWTGHLFDLTLSAESSTRHCVCRGTYRLSTLKWTVLDVFPYATQSGSRTWNSGSKRKRLLAERSKGYPWCRILPVLFYAVPDKSMIFVLIQPLFMSLCSRDGMIFVPLKL